MTKIEVRPRDVVAQIPQGFPRTRVSAIARRVQDLVAAVQAAGEQVASVEISPDGGVRIFTIAGALAGPRPRLADWD